MVCSCCSRPWTSGKACTPVAAADRTQSLEDSAAAGSAHHHPLMVRRPANRLPLLPAYCHDDHARAHALRTKTWPCPVALRRPSESLENHLRYPCTRPGWSDTDTHTCALDTHTRMSKPLGLTGNCTSGRMQSQPTAAALFARPITLRRTSGRARHWITNGTRCVGRGARGGAWKSSLADRA